MVQLSDAEVEAYLADRESRGFNSVWVALIDNTYSSHPPFDFQGNAPFAGPDFTHQDPVYWTRIDRLIKTIAEHGMAAWINPGFVGLTPSEGYLSSYRNSPYATLSSFGAWLGERYKIFPNIVWLIGGDADPARYPTVFKPLGSRQKHQASGSRPSDDLRSLPIFHEISGWECTWWRLFEFGGVAAAAGMARH